MRLVYASTASKFSETDVMMEERRNPTVVRMQAWGRGRAIPGSPQVMEGPEHRSRRQAAQRLPPTSQTHCPLQGTLQKEVTWTL